MIAFLLGFGVITLFLIAVFLVSLVNWWVINKGNELILLLVPIDGTVLFGLIALAVKIGNILLKP